jgi:hypothetical protein
LKETAFGFLFFAVVRFSPPSPKTEAAKRKAQAKNSSLDSQEPTFPFWLGLSGAKRRWANPYLVRKKSVSYLRVNQGQTQKKFEN